MAAPKRIQAKLQGARMRLEPEHRGRNEEVTEKLNDPALRLYLDTYVRPQLREAELWAKGDLNADGSARRAS